MIAPKYALSLVGLVLAFGLIAVGFLPGSKMTSEKVVALVESELPIGSNAEEIELFFKKHELPFSFDPLIRKYQSIIRDVSPYPLVDQAIVIHLYVDSDKRFTKADIHSSFTAF